MIGISTRRIIRPRQFKWLAKNFTTTHSCSSRADGAQGSSQIGSNRSKGRPPPAQDVDVAYEAPKTIAVVGGGLTGLSTALFLSASLPKAKITVYEGSGRTGGWIQNRRVEVETPNGGKGTVLFEGGARMVQVPAPGRPKFDDLPFWELVSMLNLTGELVGVPRGETLTKYIYYPDHLAKVPEPNRTLSGLWDALRTVMKEPLYKPLPRSFWYFVRNMKKLLTPVATKTNIYWHARDRRSLGEYFLLGCGSRELVDNMLSAVIHGVWGGDIWKLSDARAVPGHYDRPRLAPEQEDLHVAVPHEDKDLVYQMQNRPSRSMTPIINAYSHVWFRGGFETLTKAIHEELTKRGIEVRNDVVEELRDVGRTVRVLSKTAEGRPIAKQYEKVISTINASDLARLAPANALPTLAESHAVNIMVVGLWYPTSNLNHPHSGFGYLIPQGVSRSLNPENALGVLFDTDRELAGVPFSQLHNPNAPKGTSPLDTVPGTKMTVLMGGHYWDKIPRENLPSLKEAIADAKAVVTRHLGIPKHENDQAVACVSFSEACIPQHYVGHWSRMAKARDELQAAFGGKLAVAGPSYQMPGVFGSVRAAWDLTNYIAGAYSGLPRIEDLSADERCELSMFSPVGPTGLDRFVVPSFWFSVPKASVPWRYEYVSNAEKTRQDRNRVLEETNSDQR